MDNLNKKISDQINELHINFVRLDERVAALKDTDAKLTKLVSYLQVFGVIILVLGVGGGWLTTRFFAAQSKIDELSQKIDKSDAIIAQQMKVHLEEAKVAFDTHVLENPELANFITSAKAFETLTVAANKSETAKPIKANEGEWGDWTKPVMAPAGCYVAGISVRFEAPQGGKKDDTALNAVQIYCLPFKR